MKILNGQHPNVVNMICRFVKWLFKIGGRRGNFCRTMKNDKIAFFVSLLQALFTES